MLIILSFLLFLFFRYLYEKYHKLDKDEAAKYIGKLISKHYDLKSVKGNLIREEMIYHYENGCDTKESLNNILDSVINKIVYFGRKNR